MSDTDSFDPLVDERPSRYVIGIDLGTTNSAIAYVDTQETPWQVRMLSVPQLVAPDVVEARETLPSFHYECLVGGSGSRGLRLPWQQQDATYAIGAFARDQGGQNPGRMIQSAKSWLCHTGVDRTADLLPWHGAADVQRLSPVEVSARILMHFRDAWNARFPQHPLAEQDIVLTLPASFDEIARELTVEAAARADLRRVVLLEEPQAAFYAWVHKHRDDWQTRVRAGQAILVCDIGGGTSDFTLIQVRTRVTKQDSLDELSDHAEPSIQFHRVAVGNHLILGGDNLDLALARYLETRIVKQAGAEGKLSARQWDVLVHSCQRVKEQLLSADAPERLTVNLPGAGSRMIGGGIQQEVSRDEVRALLVDGFLPRTLLREKPMARQSGFQEFGLPYAADHAITRYLAAFLSAHGASTSDGGDATSDHGIGRPDIILLNGGFFASPVLRERLLAVVRDWYRPDTGDDWSPEVLDNDRLDLAVARGAAYYGMVRRGEGVRIAANLARSYYVSVEAASPTAVCLVPGSTLPGQDIELSHRAFKLLVSEPVEFPLWVSSTRLTDRPGDLVTIDREQMVPLPPIRTVLRTRSRRQAGTISVLLNARLTDLGTIDLWCRATDRDRSWRLQFDVRSATQTDRAAHQSDAEAEGVTDEETWDDCRKQLAGVFGDGGSERPESLVKRLAACLNCPKNQWPTPLLRRIWEALMEWETGRRRSAEHEARWINLLGFALRPGYGLAVDDWRVAETWRSVQGRLVHSGPTIRNEAMVLWRRIAGGLSRGQQQALADPLLASIRNLHHRHQTGKTRGEDSALRPNELVETLRLLGSLELLDVSRKIELGNMLVDLLPKRKLVKNRSSLIWALGRLGQRVPIYGPLNTVVPRDSCQRWLEVLIKSAGAEEIGPLAVMQLARRTDDRYRDLSAKQRDRALAWLEDAAAPTHLLELVSDGGRLDMQEQRQLYGESLPNGLRLE